MSENGGPTPSVRPAQRPFNAPRVIPMRSPGAPAAPPANDRSAGSPVALGTAGFVTTSLELASYLVLTGHRIVRITGPRTRRRIVFEAVSESDRLSFYNGAPAPARQLFEVWHSLRHGLMNLLD